MKRFLIFAFDNYYPFGGWLDFVCSVDTEEETQTVLKEVKSRRGPHSCDWFQVVDTHDNNKLTRYRLADY